MRKGIDDIYILFFGAGVIGNILAGKLCNAGQNVTVLDREPRLSEIRAQGILLENGVTGEKTSARVNTVEVLGPNDYYDLVVVPVRADQLPDILPVLAANLLIPNILIMVNNPKGPGQIVQSLVSKGDVPYLSTLAIILLVMQLTYWPSVSTYELSITLNNSILHNSTA